MNKNKLFNLMLVVAIGLSAYFLSQLYILLDPLVIGILLGMAVRLIISFIPRLSTGLEISPRPFIFLGIILYGINLKFHKLLTIMPLAWLQLIVSMVVIFWLAGFLGKLLKINEKTSILTAVGTAICGASAIVMATPTIKAEKEDTGKALIAITLWGLIGVFLSPIIQKLLAMSEGAYALFVATTLPQTGMVKMAALFLGKNVEALALSIKVARTALIIPVLIILAILFREKEENQPLNSEKNGWNFPSIFWALAGFVLVGLLFSFFPILNPYAEIIKPYSTIVWTLAMAGIGLTIEIKSLIKGISRPLILGLFIWLAGIAIFMLGYWTIIK